MRVRHVMRHGARVERSGIDVQPSARTQHVRDHEAEHERDARHHLEVQQCLEADATDLLQALHPRNAHRDRAEDHQRNQHLDETDEGVAERFHFDAEHGPEVTDENTGGKSDQDLHVEMFEHAQDGVSSTRCCQMSSRRRCRLRYRTRAASRPVSCRRAPGMWGPLRSWLAVLPDERSGLAARIRRFRTGASARTRDDRALPLR